MNQLVTTHAAAILIALLFTGCAYHHRSYDVRVDECINSKGISYKDIDKWNTMVETGKIRESDFQFLIRSEKTLSQLECIGETNP